MPSPDENLIAVPYGQSMERIVTSRYHWDNAERGEEPFVIFQATRRGEGRFHHGGRDHPVPPGSAFIAVAPEESRYFYPPEGRAPWEVAWVNFYGELGIRLWSGLRERGGPVVPLSPAAFRMLERLTVRCRAPRPDRYALSTTAYELSVEILRHLPSPRRASPLEGALVHLRRHYREPLRVKEAAAVAGMSREHFTRLFAKETGESPAAHLRRLRLEAAARLLRATTLPVAEVALRSGFPSATKLGALFRRRYRLTPTAYRKRA